MLMHKWMMSTVEELWFYYLFIFNSDGRLACKGWLLDNLPKKSWIISAAKQ